MRRKAHGWNMTERKTSGDQNDTPEDVATLYSWANLHGAKYRDFSASRAQTREKARQRVQEAIAEERERAREEAEGKSALETRRAAEAARQAEAERQAEIAAQQVSQRSIQQASHPAPPAYPATAAWQQPAPNRYPAPQPGNYGAPPAPPAAPANPSQPQFRGYPALKGIRTTSPPSRPSGAAPREDLRIRETATVVRDDFSRPAWLTDPRAEAVNPGPGYQSGSGYQPNSGYMSGQVHQPAQSPVPQAPENTLQASRDRLTARWYALKGVFEAPQAPAEAVAASPATSRPPVLAVFSLAGGVGKTSLVATLARALSSRGERVLLIDTATFGLLPFFFGANDQRPGVLRTFTPPGTGDAPVQLLTVDSEGLGPESANHEALSEEIQMHARGANRVIVDIATASANVTRRVLRMAPSVLVPVIPDMSSIVSVGAIDAFFRQHPGPHGKPIQPFYVLNQFDHSLPLHLDVREVLREQVGERLITFAVRRSPAVSEALAEGMTVIDYAPNSPAAEDYAALAGWAKTVAAPVSSSYRGVRWSER